MRTSLVTRVIVLSLTAAASGGASAQGVPDGVTFTARVDDGGQPLAGVHSFGFRLFDVAAGGAEVWRETHASVTAVDGLVFIELGSVTTLDGAVFDGGGRWLEITVDGACR